MRLNELDRLCHDKRKADFFEDVMKSIDHELRYKAIHFYIVY